MKSVVVSQLVGGGRLAPSGPSRRSLTTPALRPARTGRPLPAAPQAAAAAPAAAAAVYEATGVPLVDTLMSMATVETAAKHSMQLVAAAAIGVVVGSIVMSAVEKVAGGRLTEEAQGGRLNLPAAVLASVLHPAQALLPLYGMAYAITVWSALMQVAAVRMSDKFATLCRGYSKEVLGAIKHFTQLVQDTSELVLIIFAAWAALSLKNRVIAWLAARLASDKLSGNDFIIALLTPLSSALSAAIFVAAGATALSAYGINVGPLMASVGGIGLAVGLATQSLAANVVSALALYSGRPFVVGDRIQLLKGGSPMVEGVVEAVDPVRTTIIDDNSNPIYMSNTEVTACVIRNLSQGQARRQAA